MSVMVTSTLRCLQLQRLCRFGYTAPPIRQLFASIVFVFLLAPTFAQTGQSMPDVKLKDLTGRAVNAKEYSSNGKITVITFWATWCKPCITQVSNLNEVLEEWEQKYDVALVAVSTDNARNVMKVKPFADSQGWEFEILLDSNEDLRRAVNASSVPFTMLLDKHGKVAYTHSGYREGDEEELEARIKSLSRN